MPKLNMNGPYTFDRNTINAEVTRTSPGNYALGYISGSTFHALYVGRAVSTSGPGATNMMTGIADAYFGSVPVLYLTGQVNTYISNKKASAPAYICGRAA